MRRVWRKVKSNSGASMLFALLVFMLCVLAGTAALTAAAANSGRYTHMEAEQQDYLSVASAARVVKDELVGSTFTASFTGENRNLPTPSTTTGNFTSNCNLGSVFGETFKDYFIHLYINHKWTAGTAGAGEIDQWFRDHVTDNWTVGTSPEAKIEITGIDGMSEVTLVLEADENFTITATLYTGEEAEPRNRTVIELVGDPTWTEDTKTENYYYVIPGSNPTSYSVGTKTTVVRNLSVKWTLENATVYDGGRKK